MRRDPNILKKKENLLYFYGNSKSENGTRPQCEKLTKEAPIKWLSNQIIFYKAPSLHTFQVFHGFKQCFQPALFQTGPTPPTGSHLSHFMAIIKDRVTGGQIW